MTTHGAARFPRTTSQRHATTTSATSEKTPNTAPARSASHHASWRSARADGAGSSRWGRSVTLSSASPAGVVESGDHGGDPGTAEQSHVDEQVVQLQEWLPVLPAVVAWPRLVVGPHERRGTPPNSARNARSSSRSPRHTAGSMNHCPWMTLPDHRSPCSSDGAAAWSSLAAMSGRARRSRSATGAGSTSRCGSMRQVQWKVDQSVSRGPLCWVVVPMTLSRCQPCLAPTSRWVVAKRGTQRRPGRRRGRAVLGQDVEVVHHQVVVAHLVHDRHGRAGVGKDGQPLRLERGGVVGVLDHDRVAVAQGTFDPHGVVPISSAWRGPGWHARGCRRRRRCRATGRGSARTRRRPRRSGRRG